MVARTAVPTPRLAIVTAPNGARFSVAAQDAERWQAFLNDPEWGSFRFDPQQSGGYNNRFIAGTATPSQHAHGRAIDINWQDNPLGDNPAGGGLDDPMRQFQVLQPDLARRIAERHGMTWGGDWRRPDPMHFEVRRDGPVPMQNRSLVAAAGMVPHTSQPEPQESRPRPPMSVPVQTANAAPGANSGPSAADPKSIEALVAQALGQATEEREQQQLEAMMKQSLEGLMADDAPQMRPPSLVPRRTAALPQLRRIQIGI